MESYKAEYLSRPSRKWLLRASEWAQAICLLVLLGGVTATGLSTIVVIFAP